MKRHVPAEYTSHGDQECVVCGATRDVIGPGWLSISRSGYNGYRYSRWILYGRFEPYCPGKEDKP